MVAAAHLVMNPRILLKENTHNSFTENVRLQKILISKLNFLKNKNKLPNKPNQGINLRTTLALIKAMPTMINPKKLNKGKMR